MAYVAPHKTDVSNIRGIVANSSDYLNSDDAQYLIATGNFSEPLRNASALMLHNTLEDDMSTWRDWSGFDLAVLNGDGSPAITIDFFALAHTEALDPIEITQNAEAFWTRFGTWISEIEESKDLLPFTQNFAVFHLSTIETSTEITPEEILDEIYKLDIHNEGINSASDAAALHDKAMSKFTEVLRSMGDAMWLPHVQGDVFYCAKITADFIVFEPKVSRLHIDPLYETGQN
jgi:hypothetical protein